MKRLGKPRLSRQHTSGFSLVELLVVIAVIGIIAALSIATISGLINNTGEIQAKRNAQTIAQVASAAQAAGNSTIEAAADLDEAVTIVYNNTATGAGSFTDMDFSLSKISLQDIDNAKQFLTFASGRIQYVPTP